MGPKPNGWRPSTRCLEPEAGVLPSVACSQPPDPIATFSARREAWLHCRQDGRIGGAPTYRYFDSVGFHADVISTTSVLEGRHLMRSRLRPRHYVVILFSLLRSSRRLRGPNQSTVSTIEIHPSRGAVRQGLNASQLALFLSAFPDPVHDLGGFANAC